MSVINHNHLTTTTSLSSSTSSFFAQNTFDVVRCQVVSVPRKKVGVCNCVATSPAEQT
ncbi:hypothetical protein Tco_1492301, partial [Tanacetum coccineum]